MCVCVCVHISLSQVHKNGLLTRVRSFMPRAMLHLDLFFYKLNEVLSSIWPDSGSNTHFSGSSLLNCSVTSVEDQATMYWCIYFWIQLHRDLALSQHHTVLITVAFIVHQRK